MKDLEVKDPIPPSRRIHKLVLTGGPCGGKTTGQAHLATFFESLGWKVFRVPETATVLMSGGISFGELNEEQVNFDQRRKRDNWEFLTRCLKKILECCRYDKLRFEILINSILFVRSYFQ